MPEHQPMRRDGSPPITHTFDIPTDLKALTDKSPPQRTCLVIVLATAGGSIQTIGWQSSLTHVLSAVKHFGPTHTAVVFANDYYPSLREVTGVLPDAEIFLQSEPRGTAHAVLTAKSAIERGTDDILVVHADTPLIFPQTLSQLRSALDGSNCVVTCAFRASDPTGHARLIMRDQELFAIREEIHASEGERHITLCNGGVMALSGKHALAILNGISSDNAKGEFYLSDAISVARSQGLKVAAIEVTENEVKRLIVMSQAESPQQVTISTQITRNDPDTRHQEVLAGIERLEKLLEPLSQASARIGHNNPPEPIDLTEMSEATFQEIRLFIRVLKEQPSAPAQVPLEVREAVGHFRQIGDYLLKQTDNFVTEWVKTAAKATGIATPLPVLYYVFGTELHRLAEAILAWIKALPLP